MPSQRFKPALLYGLIALGVWSYWPTLVRLVEVWSSNPDYSHGFLVPLLCGLLLWRRRHEAPKASRRVVDPWGLAALAGVMTLRALSGRFYLPELDAFTIVLWIAGAVWLAFGRRTLLWAVPALVLLAFAAPLPASLETSMGGVLRSASAELSGASLRALGQPAITEGSVVLLGDEALDVERACSGFRMFYGVLALAVACAALTRAPWWKASLLVLAAFPIALAANVIRIVLTGLTQRYTESEILGQLGHDYAALLVIPLAAAALFATMALLKRFEDPLESEPAERWRRFALVGVGAVVVLIGMAYAANRMEQAGVASLLADADARLEQGDYAGGVEALRRYTVLRPDDSEVLARLAQELATHDPTPDGLQRSYRYFERAWRLDKGNHALALTTARAAFSLGRYRTSAEACAQLLRSEDIEPVRDEVVRLRADALAANREDNLPSEAVNALREAVAIDPPATRHALLLADHLAEQASPSEGDAMLDEAVACVDRLVTQRADDPAAWLARSRFRRDWLQLLSVQRPSTREDAAADLNRALELNEGREGPAAGEVYRAVASLRLEDEEAAAAQSLLRRAIEADPKDYRAYLMLVDSLAEPGDPSASLDESIRVLEAGMASIESLELTVAIRLASLYAQAGRFEEAQSILARIDATMPSIAVQQRGQVRLAVSLVRARIDQAAGGVEESLARLRSAMRLGPAGAPSARVWRQANERLGVLLAATEWHDQAVQALLTAAALGPLELESRRVLANSAALNGDLQLAESTYQALLVDEPTDTMARAALLDIAIRRRAQVARAGGRLEGTLAGWSDLDRRLDRAAAAGMPPATVAMLRANLLSAEGKIEEALAVLEAAVAAAEQPGTLWRSLAILRHQAGDQAGALQAAEQYAAVVEEPEATFFVVRLLIRQNDLDLAAEKLTKLLETEPGLADIDTLLLLAEVDLRRGGPAAAWPQLERAAEMRPIRLRVLQTMAQLASSESDWTRLQQAESQLYEVEGDSGVYWRLFAAQRLLATTDDLEDAGFREAARVADQLLRLRPGWSESHFLQGEIARRLGNQAIATESYLEAWRRGKRDVENADRLLAGLVSQGRLQEVSAFLGQIGELLATAPRLLDRVAALPFDRLAAERLLKLAESWVERRPDSSSAHLRLGRALLVVAASGDGVEDPAALRDRAESSLREAVRLAPRDATTWAVATLLLARSSEEPQRLGDVIASLTEETPLEEPQRSLVLARVYQATGQRRLAAASYNDAIRFVRGGEDPAVAASVYAASSGFALEDSPSLAKRWAEEALRFDPQNAPARVALVRARLHAGAPMSEAIEPLADEPAIDPRPIQIAWYRTSGRADDTEGAIELIENRLDLSRADRLLLSKLYEQGGRLSTSLTLLESLTDRPDALAEEHEAFLAFWQRHFLEENNPVFNRRAQAAYRFLVADPGRLEVWLKWKYREARLSAGEENVSVEKGRALLAEAMQHAGVADRSLYVALLKTLIQEDALQLAVASAEAPPEGLTLADAVIALGSALTESTGAQPLDSELKTRISSLLESCPEEADAWRSIGDYYLIAGEAEEACTLYEHARGLNPEEAAIANNLAIAWAGRDGGRRPALAALADAESLGSPPYDLADTRAWIELLTGDPVVALEQLGTIEERRLRITGVYKLHQAMALSRSNQDDEAHRLLNEAISLGVESQPLLPAERDGLELLKQGALATGAPKPAVAMSVGGGQR